MNSIVNLFILAAISSSFNSLPTQVITPSPARALEHKPIWIDRLNGRKHPLPISIGGKPVSFYLKNPKVSPLAKALYTSRFRPTDNDSTTQLLALVTTSSQEIRPFYRWCLDFTITISDGALGEYPGEPALAYATKFPQEFFDYMSKDKTGKRYERWITIIAYSGISNYNGTRSATKKIIIDKMTSNCPTCNNKTSYRISAFANDITRHQTIRF